MTGEEILDVELGENDADASTIREYLKALLSALWDEGESFSGKRPLGNSDWQWPIYRALVKAEAVETDETFLDGDDLDSLGYGNFDMAEADRLIHLAIQAL